MLRLMKEVFLKHDYYSIKYIQAKVTFVKYKRQRPGPL